VLVDGGGDGLIENTYRLIKIIIIWKATPTFFFLVAFRLAVPVMMHDAKPEKSFDTGAKTSLWR
jgi:hypothetical protein